ncbi:GlcNAc-binding protein A [Paenibacillus larvae subsp. larvae]|uniref:GlcNAc-binding protein A n=2 Tax=Paenibacillus larvae TaxID=1464 RepID=A0A2L1TZ44_9BACL|nr:lytic polysaccharide monooxygenase [Paenibacillus larvae]AQZ48027.1 chitin-binding protein [Paenibacillus larvae subsp. pulvifaciens]AVF25945.1 GlcNAc-binding protein A [Paenibacillus larvae subsp. larvae]AVF30722.1 GlcNAc-binding protein A [Paenibacillus larvae subsp. larvae]MCY7521303.1 lytic polysaccharide monooxygenase [Paenibacillus larvae]MCY9502461.1 lytic polysaccharide monooxygenase [Paenibacillus larvae]
MISDKRRWTKHLLIIAPLLIAFGIIGLMFGEKTYAHGYIESPASRAYMCTLGQNVNCGPVQYEPQSIEALGGFPKTGPLDGQIASGGISNFKPLDVQTPDRWNKVTIKGGKNTFQWYLTAPHSTAEWKYYITKKDWDPNKPITRADLELIGQIDEGGKKPSSTVTHEINVPTDRNGYHVILGVWEIADTANAFYQVVDVNLVNEGTTPPETIAPPTSLVSSGQTSHSIELRWNASSSNVAKYEIFRDGQLIGETAGTSYSDRGLKADTTYTYTVRAVDAAGNISPASDAISVKTKKSDTSAVEEWDPNKVYTEGMTVLYKGLEYKAKYWTKGDQPDKSDAWRLMKPVILEWDKDKVYYGGDQVIYQGALYKAKWWTRGEVPGNSNVWEKMKDS